MKIATRYESVFDYGFWEAQIDALNTSYSSAGPFPHIVIDNFLPVDLLGKVLGEIENFAPDEWINYVHVNERKKGFNRFESFPPHLKQLVAELNSAKFADFVSQLTGIKGLLADESLEGGGLHESRRDGFLNIHADFVSHPHNPYWRRRVNILIYLNKNWQDEWGGQLELWSNDMKQCVQKISPLFNRCVIFSTDEKSFHGHPEPMKCPSGTVRRSIALYYFTQEGKPLNVRSTNYRARPQDKRRQWLIELDNQLLNIYTTIKRRAGLKDGFISRVSKWIYGNK
ncbi:MAG TPA: 2OG-Fe(II) oxygenase [Chitinophagales bacterium]|nr:2OG-Fe(II) oxygenase [Chitinophagales bacterium]